jgi:HEAT repeat protein
MYRDPELPVPRVEYLFPEKAKALWLRALERPEVELRCRAAETIAEAHRRGMKGLETTIPALLKALDRADQHPTVRLAAARTLIALEARQAEASLLRHAQSGGALDDLIEPALARWDYRPARAVWLKRLDDPTTPPRSLVLAIRGLGAVREKQAADRLRALVFSGMPKGAGGQERKGGASVRLAPAPPSIRLEAARALGSVREAGLEGDAEALAADPSARAVVARLAAVSLLGRHRGEAAVRVLQRLAQDPEPAVAALAGKRLLEIDPGLLVPALKSLLASSDGVVRAAAVEVLRRRPSAEHIRLLGDRLNDAHPDVRAKARRALHEFAAKKEWRERVITEATRVLAGARWQGLEQATILLTELDHKPAATRLVGLLAFERPEVPLAAAWGLRKLAVPETLPAVLSHVTAAYQKIVATNSVPHRLTDHRLSQLNQFLGQQKFRPAEKELRKFILRPGLVPIPEARAAAVWALGRLHEGQADPALVTALEGRLNASGTIPPEHPPVRRMSAVALGRMKATAALASLRKHYVSGGPSRDPINNACGWAIGQITGKAMPAPRTERKVWRDWFLSPQD